jgi:hypothetical protein
MAGLHFYCGDWLGDDKSANPINEVLTSLAKFVPQEEEERWKAEFIDKVEEQSERDVLQLSLPMLEATQRPLERYRDKLIRELGLSGPSFTLDELGGFPRRLRKEEEHLFCVSDMLKGLDRCRASGQPLCIHFC